MFINQIENGKLTTKKQGNSSILYQIFGKQEKIESNSQNHDKKRTVPSLSGQREKILKNVWLP